MKENIISQVVSDLSSIFNNEQLVQVKEILDKAFAGYDVKRNETVVEDQSAQLIDSFIASKRIEGSSEKTLAYYKDTIVRAKEAIGKSVLQITTDDLRNYLSRYQAERHVCNVTLDNIRRNLSSFFSWLEDENYILKNPVRRIHKVKTAKVVKDAYSDEDLQKIREAPDNPRDVALIDLLRTTGMRVGELVQINRNEIDFTEREIKVLGKGNKERIVYFDAVTKIHLENYLDSRDDDNPALFVHLRKSHERLQIGGVETMLRQVGKIAGVKKVHPHRFRRTFATDAIDKGMPIEQVQVLLGHDRIDTTLHYAKVKQSNVKQSHRKYIG